LNTHGITMPLVISDADNLNVLKKLRGVLKSSNDTAMFSRVPEPGKTVSDEELSILHEFVDQVQLANRSLWRSSH
jgi:hypothetical protein